MNDMFVKAFLFPFSDKKWPLKIGLGGLFSISTFFLSGSVWMGKLGLIAGLIFLSALVVPMGYMFRVLQETLQNKSKTLPAWEEWESFLKDGIIVFGILLAYSVVFILISAVLIILMQVLRVLYPVLSILNLVIAAGMIAAPTVIMVSICAYAKEKNFSAVLNFQNLVSELKKNAGLYFIAALVLLGAGKIFSAVQGMFFGNTAFMFGTFPLVSLLGPFISFYMLLVAAQIYGTIYKGGK